MRFCPEFRPAGGAVVFLETPRVSDAFASADARSAGQGPRSGAERLPLMRASTVASRIVAEPTTCTQVVSLRRTRRTLQTPCNTVRHGSASFVTVRHA